ncbi:MAG: formylglycine-generating enzyme family protein [Nitrospira sp.]|nr:formylglycine-generating enzyme family protein [Nitrospira sp.]
MTWCSLRILCCAIAAGALLISLPALEARGPEEHDAVSMVVVPAGPFLMGSSEGQGRADEWPQRTVHVDAFAIDSVEVTNARFLAFLEATGHRPPPNPYGEGSLTSAKGIEDLPVVQVNWHDAADYCQWAGKRLPTEAEWEKAARGTDGRRFPWGNEPPTGNRVNYDQEWNDGKALRPVGTTPGGQSPYGVHDMAGNAREWIRDWYAQDYYKQAPDRNPTGPENAVLKVIRGGSWRSPQADITAPSRGRGGFALRTHGTGFRCVRGPG